MPIQCCGYKTVWHFYIRPNSQKIKEVNNAYFGYYLREILVVALKYLRFRYQVIGLVHIYLPIHITALLINRIIDDLEETNGFYSLQITEYSQKNTFLFPDEFVLWYIFTLNIFSSKRLRNVLDIIPEYRALV